MAYDIKKLVEKIKAKGLPSLLNVAEEEALVIYSCTKEWLKESALESDNKIDDVVMGFLDNADPLVLPAIDKIDGQKDL